EKPRSRVVPAPSGGQSFPADAGQRGMLRDEHLGAICERERILRSSLVRGHLRERAERDGARALGTRGFQGELEARPRVAESLLDRVEKAEPEFELPRPRAIVDGDRAFSELGFAACNFYDRLRDARVEGTSHVLQSFATEGDAPRRAGFG